ncbi:hypothetical protein VPH35_000322 [Triticum aestivum]
MEAAAAAASSSSRSCVDRLGDLPDCLLQGILSFLGSRQAVQTTALSRRWRNVWRSVPCVDIDQREFPSVPRVDIDPREYVLHGLDDSGWHQLGHFANMMTTLRPGVQVGPAPLDAFRLYLVGRGPFDDWVHFSLMRRPAAVDVHYAYGSAMNLPPFLSFSLDPACADITSRLTTLRLFGLSLADDFAEQIRDRCPVLESLHVESCVCCCHTIASPTLKTLAIVLTHHDYRSAPLLLVLPRLASLRLVLPFGSTHGYPVAIAPPENNVVQASLCISDTDGEELLGLGQPVTKYKRRFLKSMYHLLLQLPNVRNLVLSGFTTMMGVMLEPTSSH